MISYRWPLLTMGTRTVVYKQLSSTSSTWAHSFRPFLLMWGRSEVSYNSNALCVNKLRICYNICTGRRTMELHVPHMHCCHKIILPRLLLQPHHTFLLEVQFLLRWPHLRSQIRVHYAQYTRDLAVMLGTHPHVCESEIDSILQRNTESKTAEAGVVLEPGTFVSFNISIQSCNILPNS